MYVISSFRREVAENCALQCYYAASSANFLLTLQHNLSVPSSGFKKLKKKKESKNNSWTLRIGTY